jgi:DNA gyrase inhibitor GyrI
MSDIEVRIVRLEPMRVASAWGFGKNPEEIAWKKLIAWAKSKGLFDAPEAPRIFGFNNPDPGPGSPNYGYEFWITVSPDVEPEGEIRVKEFSGGLYAVTKHTGPVPEIGDTWKKLSAWLAASKHQSARHQWLEEHFGSPDEPEEILYMDLYAPVAG